MSDAESNGSLSGTERILAAVKVLEHTLPAQAPLGDFVHHNTLHGYQSRPFPQALAHSRKVSGHYGYLPAATFQSLYRQGRIERKDLEAVIAADPELKADQLIGSIPRGVLIRLRLEHDIKPLTAVQLAWEIEEKQALTHLHPDVNGSSRALVMAWGEEKTLGDLWRAALEQFGVQYNPWYRENRLDGVVEQESDFATDSLFSENQRSSEEIMAQIRLETTTLWRDLTGEVGVSLSFRSLLLALTGEDILAQFYPFLLRGLSAFLDLGVAGWS